MTGVQQIPFHVFVGHLFEKHTFRQVFWVLVGWREISPLSYSTSSHVTVICPLHLVRGMVCRSFLFCRLCLYGVLCPTEDFAVCWAFAFVSSPQKPLSVSLSWRFSSRSFTVLLVKYLLWRRRLGLWWRLSRVLFCGNGPLWCCTR